MKTLCVFVQALIILADFFYFTLQPSYFTLPCHGRDQPHLDRLDAALDCALPAPSGLSMLRSRTGHRSFGGGFGD
ncbi:MAG: hypothetical protein RL204_1305 [Bacteroidota bacterium]|jgi:hypothetical protein